jgi:hypothetical protein
MNDDGVTIYRILAFGTASTDFSFLDNEKNVIKVMDMAQVLLRIFTFHFYNNAV